MTIRDLGYAPGTLPTGPKNSILDVKGESRIESNLFSITESNNKVFELGKPLLEKMAKMSARASLSSYPAPQKRSTSRATPECTLSMATEKSVDLTKSEIGDSPTQFVLPQSVKL